MKLSDSFGQEVDFEFPETKQIAVNCSGGADSSILLYMVCDWVKNHSPETRVNVLSCSNDFKHRWNGRKAADVINYTIDRLRFDPIDLHYTYYRDFQDEKYFHDIEPKLFADERVDLIVSGITSNPRVEAHVESSEGEMVDLAVEALPIRNTDNAPTLHINDHGHRHWTPFINVDKRWIAAMYVEYDVMDMFDLTRSCESVPDPRTNNETDRAHAADFDPNFEHEPCGTCWWCLERKWAFGRF